MTQSSGKSRGYLSLLVAGGLFAVLCMPALAQVSEGVDGINIATSSVPYTIESIPGSADPIGDFVVGPGKVQLDIKPGESKTIMMSVTNRIGNTRDFRVAVEDMQGSAEPGKTVDLLGSVQGPYTLRDYIQLPFETITLEQGQRVRFPVTISIPADAEPGGKYGSVLVNTVAVKRDDASDGSLTSQSPIIARIGTLFFITIPGDVVRDGQLVDFAIPSGSFHTAGPINMSILFENKGSIHLTPSGDISVRNIFGQEVGSVVLDPWFAMPQSYRSREVIFDRPGLFGRYEATLTLDRGYEDQVDSATIVFYVLPWKPLVGIGVALFVLVFLFRFFFSTFEFRRKGVS